MSFDVLLRFGLSPTFTIQGRNAGPYEQGEYDRAATAQQGLLARFKKAATEINTIRSDSSLSETGKSKELAKLRVAVRDDVKQIVGHVPDSLRSYINTHAARMNVKPLEPGDVLGAMRQREIRDRLAVVAKDNRVAIASAMQRAIATKDAVLFDAIVNDPLGELPRSLDSRQLEELKAKWGEAQCPDAFKIVKTHQEALTFLEHTAKDVSDALDSECLKHMTHEDRVAAHAEDRQAKHEQTQKD